jgi:uncharacterized repeat protein (TIGR03803 family)
LIRDALGNLYGTAQNGGAFGNGVVFKLCPTGTETVLYSFTGGADGGTPQGGLVRDPVGNLYGTTAFGGIVTISCGEFCGVVFKLTPTGTETVLHSFTGGADGALDGFVDNAGLIRDAVGNLYGTAPAGGIQDQPGCCGVVFELSPTGTETVLYSFTGGADGGVPLAGLVRDPVGNLYGTIQSFGAYGYGVVFQLEMAAHRLVRDEGSR